MSRGLDTLNTLLQGLCSKTTKHSIMLANKTTQKLLKSEAKITLTEQVYQSGNLTAYNGGVRVGKGIQAVCISGCLYINEGLSINDLLYVLLYKNSVKLATAMTARANYAGAVSLPVSPFIVSVQEGDVFYMYANNDTYARGNVPAYWQNRIVVESVGGGYSVIVYLQHLAAKLGGVRHE